MVEADHHGKVLLADGGGVDTRHGADEPVVREVRQRCVLHVRDRGGEALSRADPVAYLARGVCIGGGV